LQGSADGFACFDERCQVWRFVLSDWCWHGDYVEVGTFQVIRIAGEAKACCLGQQFVFYFQRGVVAGLEFVDSALVNVKADDIAFFSELYG